MSSIEDNIESIVERAIRIGLADYHRDNPANELLGVDLDFINRDGKRINVGWVKVPCVPRIGDRFEFDHGDPWNPTTYACTVTNVTFSNSNERDQFYVEIAITENP